MQIQSISDEKSSLYNGVSISSYIRRYENQTKTYNSIYVQSPATPWAVEALPRFAHRFIQAVVTSGGTTVVDLCAGNAAATIQLAQLPGAEHLRFVAVELNPTPVEQAREAIRAAGLEHRVSVMQADALYFDETLGFTELEGRCDVFERYGLTTHVRPGRDRSRYWSVLRRLLRPGGYFAVTAFSKADTDFYGYNAAADPRAELEFPLDHVKYPGVYHKFHTVDALSTALRRQGFSVVRSGRFPHPRVPETRSVCEVLARSKLTVSAFCYAP